jgi:hypothetical protein
LTLSDEERAALEGVGAASFYAAGVGPAVPDHLGLR